MSGLEDNEARMRRRDYAHVPDVHALARTRAADERRRLLVLDIVASPNAVVAAHLSATLAMSPSTRFDLATVTRSAR